MTHPLGLEDIPDAQVRVRPEHFEDVAVGQLGFLPGTWHGISLSAWGELLQGVLRLTGPVLLGLALLALRDQVKR